MRGKTDRGRQEGEASTTLTIVVPTRNEMANVVEFSRRVHDAFAMVGDVDWQILFVDDSDDQTPFVIEQLRQDGARVDLLHRSPAERVGTIAGAITAGIAKVDTAVVAVIDADLQHPPEILPRLVRPVLDGSADVAFGTRYRRGGSAAGLSHRWRRIASIGANRLTHVIFPRLRKCSDPGSGLFAVRLAVLDEVALRPRGFKMLTEILVRGRWQRLYELPYHFEERAGGLSNAGLKAGADFVQHLLHLRLTTPPRPGGVTRIEGPLFRPVGEVDLDLVAWEEHLDDDAPATSSRPG